MTKADIKEILGEPNSIKSAFRYKENADPIGKFFVNAMFDGWHEKWYYGKKPSILSSIIPFYPFGVPSQSYIIYFDDKNKVVWYTAPQENHDDK